jgi:hypothetical protein
MMLVPDVPYALDTSPSRPDGEKTDESGVVDVKHNQATIKHVGSPVLVARVLLT